MVPPDSAGPRIRFSVMDDAFALFNRQAGTWILAALVTAIFAGAVGGLLSRVSFFGGLVGGLPADFCVTGMYRMAFAQMRGQPIKVGDVFGATDVLGPIIVAGILSGLAITAGFICLIIPGFVLFGLWLFYSPLIADKKMDGVEAMRLSWNTLRSETFSATLFGLLIMLVVLIGALCLGIGLLFAGPIAVLAVARLYRDFFPDAQA